MIIEIIQKTWGFFKFLNVKSGIRDASSASCSVLLPDLALRDDPCKMSPVECRKLATKAKRKAESFGNWNQRNMLFSDIRGISWWSDFWIFEGIQMEISTYFEPLFAREGISEHPIYLCNIKFNLRPCNCCSCPYNVCNGKCELFYR